ncbi:SDR family oxidoreductase [Sulfitobacter sp. 915]|uniref:SDR family oxidoreductase n=1 Tax=Sulfitobacter sp. 915 TaxID=3368558 RepID=UPI0037472C59
MSKGPVLVLGARSDIGLAVAHAFAAKGHPIQLALRNASTFEANRMDMVIRYNVAVSIHEFDVLAIDKHAAFIDTLPALPAVAVCAIGLMGDQIENERDMSAASLVMRSNYEGPATILGLLGNRFDEYGEGTIVGISSVAGERGRATNYVYGSAKAGFTAFLSGLRNRLAKRGVHVVTVLPGFVLTRMTKEMALPERLTAQPAEVADAIVRAVAKKTDVIYVRPIWGLIMRIIKAIPERSFKGMKI